jgi:hypothetical protein
MKTYLYTLSIIIAATVAYFFPQFFISFGDFQLKELIIPLLQVIMFSIRFGKSNEKTRHYWCSPCSFWANNEYQRFTFSEFLGQEKILIGWCHNVRYPWQHMLSDSLGHLQGYHHHSIFGVLGYARTPKQSSPLGAEGLLQFRHIAHHTFILQSIKSSYNVNI